MAKCSLTFTRALALDVCTEQADRDTILQASKLTKLVQMEGVPEYVRLNKCEQEKFRL